MDIKSILLKRARENIRTNSLVIHMNRMIDDAYIIKGTEIKLSDVAGKGLYSTPMRLTELTYYDYLHKLLKDYYEGSSFTLKRIREWRFSDGHYFELFIQLPNGGLETLYKFNSIHSAYEGGKRISKIVDERLIEIFPVQRFEVREIEFGIATDKYRFPEIFFVKVFLPDKGETYLLKLDLKLSKDEEFLLR